MTPDQAMRKEKCDAADDICCGRNDPGVDNCADDEVVADGCNYDWNKCFDDEANAITKAITDFDVDKEDAGDHVIVVAEA